MLLAVVMPHCDSRHRNVTVRVFHGPQETFLGMCHPHLSEDLSQCYPVRVSSEHQRVCIHKTGPLASETNE